MARKKTGLSQTLFRGIDPYGQAEEEAGRENLLPLTAIRPDPDQPRRLLPPDLAQGVATGKLSPMEAMRTWVQRNSGDAALRALRRLAESIERHGLINPISVRRPRQEERVPAGASHFIVTGERRFWAFVLLVLEGRSVHAGETRTEPTHIRAGVVGSGITVRAHQLIENIMREDINAVEKARGLWALRHELSGVNYSSPKATVNDSSPSPDLVPWARVSEALGISKRYRIFLTSVLHLSPEAQDLVMEHNLAEITIRPIVQRLKDDTDLQVAALRQLVSWQEEGEAEDGRSRAVVRSVQALVEELLAQRARELSAHEAVRAAAEAVDSAVFTRQFRRRLRRALRFLEELPVADRTLLARDLALDATFVGTIDELQLLQEHITFLLEEVSRYQVDAEP